MTAFLIPEEGRRPSAEALAAASRVLTSLHDAKEVLAAMLEMRVPLPE